MDTTVSTRAGLVAYMVLALICIGAVDGPGYRVVEDFSDAAVAKKWSSVNDDVMGGVSEGRFRITDERRGEKDPSQRAWTLRLALDTVHEALAAN